MKSVKELNKCADKTNAGVMKTVSAIIDAQSFVETDKFIRSATSLGDAVGEGVVTGLADVNGEQVSIVAINGEVLKGGIGKANAKKIAKCVNNAVKVSTPVIAIVDTMGARFCEGIEAMEGYGEIVSAFSSANTAVPTVMVVKGNNLGILSYLAGICDITICYDKSVMATSSPLILAAGTTEDTAKIGIASVMATEGVSSITVKNDNECANAIKTYLSFFEGIVESTDDGNRVCRGLKRGVKIETAINQIFDAGSFFELKKEYAKGAVTGLARLNGVTVGVVALNGNENDGKLNPAMVEKISEFVGLCGYYGFPLVNLIDTKGVANCIKCQGKLIKSIGGLLDLYNNINTAKVTLVMGNAIGLGYVAFASKSVMDYVIAWEDATIGMLDNVASAELVYSEQIAKAENKEKATEELAKEYAEENTAAVTVAEKGFIDNVIAPNFSRQYLIAAVQAYISKR